MEYVQGDYIHEEEVKGLKINLGNKENESNEKISRVELVEMVKTMNILSIKVQSYKVENERLIIYQEEKNHINTQFLKILNNL